MAFIVYHSGLCLAMAYSFYNYSCENKRCMYFLHMIRYLKVNATDMRLAFVELPT